MSGNLPFAYPLEQSARLYLQVLGSLICGKPIGFHVNLFPDASRTLNCPLPTEFTNNKSHSVRAYRGLRRFKCSRRPRVPVHVEAFSFRQCRKPEVAWMVMSCLEVETNEVPPYGWRDHLHGPCGRSVENTSKSTLRFPQGTPVMQIPNPNPTSTARHEENSSHTSHPSYSVTSGFITKVPCVCKALVDVCGLSLPARSGASSTGPLNFAMYPERAVGLIFIPFSARR